MLMTHPGLPLFWVLSIVASVIIMGIMALFSVPPVKYTHGNNQNNSIAVFKDITNVIITHPWLQLLLKFITVSLFVLVIISGLYGTPVPSLNIATVLTWTFWWTLLIISVFFIGSAWCAVCPWDTIATWLVRRRLWKRGAPDASLNLRVPKVFRNVWPALIMFIALTWLELGAGITARPYATALIALAIVVLATVSLALYERKAFCRYFCPVGRTIGFYAQLAPVELRPVDTNTCESCKTLDCYHGTETSEPCPTHLVMGTLKQNTYCTSCGACVRSCPHKNINWRLRPMATEAKISARPHWDESWFILGLLALTSFHGLSMLPFWEDWLLGIAAMLGESGQLLASFSLALFVFILIPVVVYCVIIALTARSGAATHGFRHLFMTLIYTVLPLAFSYHIAHNLGHLVRESGGAGSVLMHPFGTDIPPAHHLDLLIPENILFTLQAGIMIFGIWMAIVILQHRGHHLYSETSLVKGWRFMPMLVFVSSVALFNTWLLMQPMTMRM